MYQVSNFYEEQIRQDIRNLSYIKVKFGLVNPDAVKNAYLVSTSPKLSFATDPELQNLNKVARWYSTLETNFWVLDGSMNIYPTNNNYQGYISSQLSSEDTCEYPDGIHFVIGFTSGVYAFRGLTFTFDNIQNVYPTEIQIIGYLNDTQIYSSTVEVNSAEFTLEQDIPEVGSYINKLEIICTKSSTPNRRLRLQDITLGVIKTMTSDIITSATWTRSNDLMNTVLPSNALSFSFYDINNEYNPDNPEGIWEYLETGQAVSFTLGYELNDGSIEWIPGSTLYTTGNPSVDNSGALANVTFSTNSQLQSLTDIYNEGTYYAPGMSLYMLADNILRWCGLVDDADHALYTLSPKLRNYKFNGVLPAKEARQLLQLIANAGMCLVNVDRSGQIVFFERSTVESEFAYQLSDIMSSMPSINKYPYLKTLSVLVNEYKADSESTELTSLDISGATSTEYTLEFSPATNVLISTSDGLTLDKIVGVYGQKAVVKVTGSGTLSLTGNQILTNTYRVSKTYNLVGEDCELENELICSQEQAIEYLDWMAEVLQKRNVYTFEDRGFPEVDETDIISISTMFTDVKQGIITKSQIEFNGALSGSTEVLG